MKKRFLAVFLALALCVGLAVPAFAADTSGSCGDNVTWSYNNGTLSIQGTGNMENYFGFGSPWSSYREQIHTVNIGAGVTSVGMYAFTRCRNLTSVTLPNSVTTIGYAAFNECSSLASVTIPNSVTAIDSYAFSKCSNLTGITIPSNVTTIGYEAFSGSGLTTVTIPNSVITIQPGAFSWCRSLSGINVVSGNSVYCSVDGVLFDANQTYLHTYPAGKADLSYNIPTSITTIYASAFSGSSNLISIIIPNSVTTITGYAFDDCQNLTSITLPASVTAIEEDVFDYCDSLKDIYYGGNENQWKQLFKDHPLNGITIHYNSTAPGFTDVSGGAWYADAVNWAVSKDITNGTGGGKFSPAQQCTHAQILTFLYRADRGQGKAEAADMDKAVAWAKEKGMIDSTFNGKAYCTRADAVSYIWQALGRENANASSFTDVPAGAGYAKAVSWAVANGVTNGTNAAQTEFSPGKVCDRGTIVTFLHRAFVEEVRLK